MDNRVIRDIAKDFSTVKLQNFLRRASSTFSPKTEDLGHIPLPEGFPVSALKQLGEIPFSDGRRLIVVGAKVERELTTRAGRKAQYEIAKRVLKHEDADAGLFVFYDDNGRFRMSLVVVHYLGRRRTFSHYRRYTYFVDPHLPNKTFVTQISKADFSSLDSLLEAFSIAAVTDEFYREFEPIFQMLVHNVCGTDDDTLKWDFALLFTIRTIFLGFVQKRGWLGDNPRFLQDFWKEYRSLPREVNSFYKRWLKPLFFEALRHPPGRKVAYQDNEFPPEIKKALQMAPYLNGELFREKSGVDDQGLWLPDEAIGEFFDFLFQYNFTVEENELYDEELEVNPEFLGIIFERLLNKDLGSVYTPRVEVDLMCRWSLVKWLECQGDFNLPDLYELFFHARESEEERVGDFSTAEITRLIGLLENVQIVDPAAGSGAFLVGMLQVLDEILNNLYNRPNTAPELKKNQPTPYERKKHIIGRSLYGVDVHRTAVWIAQLRLWLTLFVDLPEDQRYSQEPLLPNLAFKVRRGDSLVQRVGDMDFPVRGFQGLPLSTGLKQRLKRLAQAKVDFFFNRSSLRYQDIQEEEFRLFREILRERLDSIERKLSTPEATQARLLDVGPSKEERQRREARKALEKQRESLKRQLQALQKGDVPFLWVLEFAEIFTEKGGFDVVIGNPPYVNKEKIKDPGKNLSANQYKQALNRMLLLDFPYYFGKTYAGLKFRVGMKPDGRSDLYTYFYVRTLKILNKNGIHCFVCSNSWLDAKYGKWLRKFVATVVPMYYILDNRAKRTFTTSSINTVITILGSPEKKDANINENVVRFVSFGREFDNVVYSENLIYIDSQEKPIDGDHIRVYPIPQGVLVGKGKEKLYQWAEDKWGSKYLRAPVLWWDIVDKISNYFVGLETMATFLGYIHSSNIGDEFPKRRVVMSSKGLRSISVTSKCPCITVVGVKDRGASTVVPDIAVPRSFDKKHVVYYNEASVLFRRFYKLVVNDDYKHIARSLSIFLNSTLAGFYWELLGKPEGDGALNVYKEDFSFVLVPPVDILSQIEKHIDKKFVYRPIDDVFNECGLDPTSQVPLLHQTPKPRPDRKMLDDFIFDVIGLTESAREDVYRLLCHLVWERISKAKSLKKRQGKKHVDKGPIQESACGDS